LFLFFQNYQLPQGTKRKNVYTNDKDKNNIKKIRKNEVYRLSKCKNFWSCM